MHWRFLALFAAAVLTGCSIQHSGRSWSSPRITMNGEQRGDAIEGKWRANADAFGGSPFSGSTWVSIEIEDIEGREKVILGRRVGEVDGLLAALKEGGPEVNFGLRDEAGEITFNGAQGDEAYTGTFGFVASSTFRASAAELLAAAPTIWELMEFCILGVELDYIRSLSEGADARFTARDVARVRRSGATAEYVKAMHAAGIWKTEDIVRLRHSGATAELVSGLRDAGYSFSAEEIARLRHAGVTAAYAAAWKQAGFSLSAEEIVRLRHAGVPQDYGRSVKAAGAEWGAEEMVRLRHAGVSADFLGDLRSISPELKAEEIVRLRHAGVSAEYYSAWAQSGYKRAEDVVRLRQAGVPPSYAGTVNIPGRELLPAETIVELRRRGVSPELARKLRE